MTWRDHIHSDQEILGGKPMVRGTRLAVDFLLGLLAEGWSQEQLLENYPQLTPDALRAVFAFASEALHDDTFYSVEAPAVLTQHGRGAAVLLDIQEYERLLDRAELADDIRIAEAQVDAGEGVPHDVARDQVLSLLRE